MAEGEEGAAREERRPLPPSEDPTVLGRVPSPSGRDSAQPSSDNDPKEPPLGVGLEQEEQQRGGWGRGQGLSWAPAPPPRVSAPFPEQLSEGRVPPWPPSFTRARGSLRPTGTPEDTGSEANAHPTVGPPVRPPGTAWRRASWGPEEAATPQPSQQAAVGSAPMSPTELGRTLGPEDAVVGICLAVATGLRALLGSRAGQLLLHSAERALGTTQEWLHRYLRSDRAAAGPGVAGAEARGLGGLRSPPARAVQWLRQQQEDARHHLTRLWHILDVAVATRRGSPERCHHGQEQRWGQRSPAQENPSPNPACSQAGGLLGAPPVPVGYGRCQELGEGRALALQLRDEFGRLLAQARRLPAPLREGAQQAQDNMGELHRAFVLAGSLRELEEALTTQGHGWVAQAWEVLEALVEFLLRHPQEPWQGEVAPAAPARE